MKLQAVWSVVLLAGCASAGGCKSDTQAGWSGPREPVSLSVDSWTYDNKPARKIKTAHYTLNTTIADNRFLDTTAQVMEGAYQQYQKMVPGLSLSDRPMDCFLFANRIEWERFTRTNAGPAAPIYLRINRGGYAIRDWYVSYYLGDYSTYSVASHEGWHQFCGRNFKTRLPPFLEEGVACLFEGVSLAGPHGLPQWNFSVNLNRAVKLRQAMTERRLWPLEKLISMHAGMVVDSSGQRIDAFYAQNWAFARFLWESQNAKYRPSFQKLLTDAASGSLPNLPTQSLLEQYLAIPFPQLEKEYLQFVSQIAFDQFQAQWQS